MKRKFMMKNVLMSLLLMIIGFAFVSAKVNAKEADAEITEVSRFITAEERIDVRETPQVGAEVIFSYEAGATIFVTGETTDDWYRVVYQGQTGYINSRKLQGKIEENSLDISALDKEMEAEEAMGKLIVEETERYRAEAKRSKLWGTVIVLLIVGILITGIISTIQSERARKKTEDIWDLDKD